MDSIMDNLGEKEGTIETGSKNQQHRPYYMKGGQDEDEEELLGLTIA